MVGVKQPSRAILSILEQLRTSNKILNGRVSVCSVPWPVPIPGTPIIPTIPGTPLTSVPRPMRLPSPSSKICKEIEEGGEVMLHLGLDVNTNSTGFVVLDEAGALWEFGVIRTPKEKELLDIGEKIEHKLLELRDRIKNQLPHQTVHWKIGIEDFMKAYNYGRFQTKGLFALAQLNGVTSYACFKTFGSKPYHVHPSTARAVFDLVAPRTKDENRGKEAPKIKDLVFSFVRDRHPEINWAMNNRTEKPLEENYDIADAYVIALHSIFEGVVADILQDHGMMQEFHDEYTRLHKKRLSNRFNDQKDTAEYVRGVYESSMRYYVKQHQHLFL